MLLLIPRLLGHLLHVSLGHPDASTCWNERFHWILMNTQFFNVTCPFFYSGWATQQTPSLTDHLGDLFRLTHSTDSSSRHAALFSSVFTSRAPSRAVLSHYTTIHSWNSVSLFLLPHFKPLYVLCGKMTSDPDDRRRVYPFYPIFINATPYVQMSL